MTEKEKASLTTPEKSSESEQLGEIAHERHEAIRVLQERELRKAKERHSEREILAKAKEIADKAEESHRDKREISPAGRRSGPISKAQLKSSFNAQMKYAETEMSASERLFSKFIHLRPVEKTTDMLGGTLFRPNAMLSGSIAAFIGLTILYFVAKHYGFQLSGFETVATFIAGWIIGILYDYFSVMIRGRKK